MKQIRATGRHLASACIAFGILASGTAHAQLDLQSIGASLLGGGQQQAAPTQGGVAQLLQAYVGANQQVLTGQSSLASAMGLTGAAGQAQQAASQLAGGNALTPAALSQMGGAQQSVSQALGWPSRAAVRRTARSTSRHSATASRRSGGKPRSIRNCSRAGNLGSTSAASLLQSGLNPQNMQAASYIAQSAPGQLQSLATTLSQAVQFATSQAFRCRRSHRPR